MSTRTTRVEPVPLAEWCVQHLGSPPVEELFRVANLSVVVGLRLADESQVVVKIRPAMPRLAACVEVQRQLFRVGYPCPEPLTDPKSFGERVATAERYVSGGAMLPRAGKAAHVFAEALARLIALAPSPGDVGSLGPGLSWTSWDHDQGGIWPPAENHELDLNGVKSYSWIDEVGREAQARLRAERLPIVVGHGDWYTGNLRWQGDSLLVAHDWDSVIADSEAAIVGFAAALFPAGDADGDEATINETEEFLAAYADACGRDFSCDELECAWSAGVWLRAFDAKRQHANGRPVRSLNRDEAYERLWRAGAGRTWAVTKVVTAPKSVETLKRELP